MRIATPPIRSVVLAVSVLHLPMTESHAQITYRTVALYGDPAPGMPDGVTLLYVGLPTINDHGDVAFAGIVEGPGVGFSNDDAVWMEQSGTLALVSREGEHPPGAPDGVVYDWTYDPMISNTGDVAFLAELDGGSPPPNAGIWMGRPGFLEKVAIARERAPGTEDGVLFAPLTHQNVPRFSDEGHVAFRAELVGPGVDETNDIGLWTYASAALELVARSGMQVPGLPDGVVFDLPMYDQPVVSGLGQVAFRSTLEGPGVDASNREGIWSYSAEALSLVVRAGWPAPNMDAGVSFTSFGRPRINDAGQMAFAAGVTGPGINDQNDVGVWAGEPGSLVLVAREGDQVPQGAAGETYLSFGQAVISASGALALSADTTDGVGLWVGTAGSMTVVAHSGMHAPGTPEDVTFGTRIDFSSVNALGQVAFDADLTGPGVDSFNDWGFWATDASGTLQPIVREADVLETAPGVFETVGSYGLWSYLQSGGQDGIANSFNDLGQLAFWAGFVGGNGGGAFVASTNPDSDGDGVFDSDDACPEQDAGGLDANHDGCIDSTDDLALLMSELIPDDAGAGTGLIHLAENAAAMASRGNLRAAQGQLQALTHALGALAGNVVSEEDADLILEFIDNVVAQWPS